MERKKKTHLMFLLLALLCVGAAQTENCPSDPDIARTDLSCESDYNRTITCVWNSTSASDLPDNVCTLKASRTSKYVNYNAKCKLEPVDVSRPTLRKCTLIFNIDDRVSLRISVERRMYQGTLKEKFNTLGNMLICFLAES